MRPRFFRALALLIPVAGVAAYTAACVGDSSPSGTTGDGTDGGGTTPDASPQMGTDGGSVVDSGGGGVDAGADASTFTPADIDKTGSLALWLMASSSAADVDLSNGSVAVWKDHSKNHNDASSAVNRPTLKTGALGAHDAVHFNDQHTVLSILDAPSLQFGTDEFAIFAVAREAGDQPPTFFAKAAYVPPCLPQCGYSSGMLFTGNGKSRDAGGTGLGLGLVLSTNDSANLTAPTFDDGGFHIVGLRRSGKQTMLFYVDHKPVVTNVLGVVDVSEPDSGVKLGAAVNAGTVLTTPDIDFAEVVIVHTAQPGAVTDATVKQLVDYLSLKYGL